MGQFLPNPLEVFTAGDVLEGRYEVVEHLGGGGMAVVFLAKDSKLHGRQVVLKSPFAGPAFKPADLRARFEDEVASLIRLGRVDGVVDILDLGEHKGCPFYVAQWMGGGSLQDRLGPQGRQAAGEVAAWVTPLASALDGIHKRKFVHRDVKPDNILFTEEGVAQLADFGIARVFSGGASGLTTGYTKIGTQAYWAPEQEAGIALDGRADQFSLAATAYRALTGQPPATRGVPEPVRALAPAVSKACETAIHKALEPKRENRFATCTAFARAFAAGIPKSKVAKTNRATRKVPQTAPKHPKTEPSGSGRPWVRWAAVPVVLATLAGGLHLAGVFTTTPPAKEELADLPPRVEPPKQDPPKTQTPPADTTAPVITVSHPPGLTHETVDAVVTIRGTVADEDLDVLRANGDLIAVSNGAFTHPVAVPIDTRTIVSLVATDKSGNESAPVVVTLRRRHVAARYEAPLTAFIEAAKKGDLRAASKSYAEALDQGAPSTSIPAKHERAVLAWRKAPEITVVSPADGSTVKTARPEITVRWTTGRKTDVLLVQGQPVQASPGSSAMRIRIRRALSAGENRVTFEVRDGSEGRWKHTLSLRHGPSPSADGLFKSAVDAYQSGDHETALKQLQAYVATDPSDREVYAVLVDTQDRTLLRALAMGGEHERLMKLLITKAGNHGVPSWAKVSKEQIDAANKLKIPVAYENKLGMRFVLIPAGTFTMGSPETEEGRGDDEKQHEVTLTKAYYLATTEVTNAQYRRFKAGHDSGKYQERALDGDNQPVVNVSWEDAQTFLTWLSKQGEGTYRLPTEAEWERAARAETRTRFSFGDKDADLVRYGNFSDKNDPSGPSHKDLNDGHAVSAPAGSYQPNPWGLYDMHGNVWEWAQDWYAEDYPTGGARDPTGPSSGKSRVIRGGSWRDPARRARSASRARGEPGARDGSVGFRLARSVTP